MKVKQDQVFQDLHSLNDPSHVLLQYDFSENAEVTEQVRGEGVTELFEDKRRSEISRFLT